jgi:hypothetical protein
MAQNSSHAPRPVGDAINAGWLVFADVLAKMFTSRPSRPDATAAGWRAKFAAYRKRRSAEAVRPRALWGREFQDVGKDIEGLSSSPRSQDALTRLELLRLGHR